MPNDKKGHKCCEFCNSWWELHTGLLIWTHTKIKAPSHHVSNLLVSMRLQVGLLESGTHLLYQCVWSVDRLPVMGMAHWYMWWKLLWSQQMHCGNGPECGGTIEWHTQHWHNAAPLCTTGKMNCAIVTNVERTSKYVLNFVFGLCCTFKVNFNQQQLAIATVTILDHERVLAFIGRDPYPWDWHLDIANFLIMLWSKNLSSMCCMKFPHICEPQLSEWFSIWQKLIHCLPGFSAPSIKAKCKIGTSIWWEFHGQLQPGPVQICKPWIVQIWRASPSLVWILQATISWYTNHLMTGVELTWKCSTWGRPPKIQ